MRDQAEHEHLEQWRERLAKVETILAAHDIRFQAFDDRMAYLEIRLEEHEKKWDKRWWIGVGLLIGVAFAIGAGSFSLQHFLELVAKIH